jgi:hypothetical protein
MATNRASIIAPVGSASQTADLRYLEQKHVTRELPTDSSKPNIANFIEKRHKESWWIDCFSVYYVTQSLEVFDPRNCCQKNIDRSPAGLALFGYLATKYVKAVD